MRGLRFVLTAAVLLLGSAAHAAEPLLSPLGDDSFRLKLWGWTESAWDTKSDTLDYAAMLRLRASIETNAPWGAFVEMDFTKGVGEKDNWLRQGYVSYDVNDHLQLRAGRLFMAAFGATPPPFMLRTVNYMRFPFPVYGWGVQVAATPGSWDITWDVTGDANRRYNAGGNFDSLSSSAKILYNVSPTLQVGTALAATIDYKRIALVTTWHPDERNFLNAAAYATADGIRNNGGYVFYGYEAWKGVELHGQLDYEANASRELRATAGVRFDVGRFRLIVDHELNEDETFARFQFSF